MSFDMESITRGMLLMCLYCLISLTNANSSPQIVTGVYSICEDIPLGTVAFTINATDPDNDLLTFSLINSIYFKVEQNSGAVSVIRELDRESEDVMNVGVEVTDGLNSVQRTLTLIIRDANDNIPIFNKSSYEIEISEGTPVGESLVNVTADDRDTSSAGSIKYSIDGVTPADGFNLFNISQTGEIKLKGSLNYTSLSTFYQLRIKATDGGGSCHYVGQVKYNSNIVFVTIAVVDIPDLDPQFIGLPYTTQVVENSPIGQSVFTVSAIDPDTGINDKIIYTIESSTVNDLFEISGNGVISVSSPIDREAIEATTNGDTVYLTVKATESQLNIHGYYASATATVQINIIDINDNRPEFYMCVGDSCVKETHFSGEIFEHSLNWLNPINMNVIDLDKISQTILTLEGADKDVFSVQLQITESFSVVQLLVRQPQNLDFEKKREMILEVIATDEVNPASTATVTITIRDSNDNSPIFPESTYVLTVAEHSPVDTTIKTITAVDPDTMDQGKIKYSLLPESILQYFNVDPNTGTIYVTNATLLDREVRSVLSATLQASDTDGNLGTTVLEITVTDINDKPPVINRELYQEFVQEDKDFELKIEATDDDEPNTDNSQIVYEIVPSNYSDNFTIDPNSGVLKNVGELDREALDPDLNGRIELTVTATDKGVPPLSTTVTVIINIEDANDNVPQFQNSSYTFSVKEGEIGAHVGSVYATDLDQTTNFNRISFRIINGSFGSFIIRTYPEDGRYRGDITVDPDIELDYESLRKQFILWIEATDLEQSTAEVKVEINVLDVNDERPEFKPMAPETVKENTPDGIVGRFSGYDVDGNHSLVYELESMKCRCNGSMTACSSFILDPTGDVRVNPEETLDYEKCDQAVIEAQVVDKLTEKGENYSITAGQMVINIEDINDNAPEFEQPDNIFVVVSEIASVGTSVAGVTAVDHDSEENGQITFQVDAVKFENIDNSITNERMLFKAVTTQQMDKYVGIIQTDETLDIALKGKYLVTVNATDIGGLSTSTVLEIFTVDETHRVELEFSKSKAEVEASLTEIIRALTAATLTNVEIVYIRPENSAISRETGNTIVVAYFVFSNGTALTPEEVERLLSVPEHYIVLLGLGLNSIDNGNGGPVSVNNTLAYILLGILGGLIILLVVLITSLMCTRRNYKRKLKAAKAKNSASMVAYENQKNGAVVPGTNIYTMEGANPVLNLNIDPAMVLGMDAESYNVDKISLSSLDDIHDFSDTTKHTDSVMGEKKRVSDPPMYQEPLDEALAQRGLEKRSNNPQIGFVNHAFNTTDL